MTNLTAADTIRILVATDSHVGYNERDAERGNDSWRSFHEVMYVAREQDVDMVLHAGDLFHDNKPSTKTMKQVIQSLRMNCLGEKPCELELLSDATEHFAGPFDHVNYEDLDINVAIPFFAIHGNHDDPSGTGNFSALDILQSSGLINYYGRVPEADKIDVKPVLLQKGNTKLALYGISNVRDERLFRTFRDGNVKFFRPGTQQDDWFNLLAVHQNHTPHTETGYLPESFLPKFMDLVVWGHEHECRIDPSHNHEMGFSVMQPGSSVATSLVAGEAATKYVSLVTIKGREFETEKIRLKTVRPFVMREIILANVPEMREIMRKDENRSDITRYLDGIVKEMVADAQQQWHESQEEMGNAADPDATPPKPLIRLRVEYSAQDDGKFDIENPQRFSNRHREIVANVHDIVQFHRRKKAERTAKFQADLPDEKMIQQLNLNSIKVDGLIDMTAQSLKILPQNKFADAINQFIEKDDRHAMECFVQETLKSYSESMIKESNDGDDLDAEAMEELMAAYKSKLEEQFARGEKKTSHTNRKPKPLDWDSEEEGRSWEESLQSLRYDNADEQDEQDGDDMEQDNSNARVATKSGRGGRGSRGGRVDRATAASNGNTRKTATAAAAIKKAPAKPAVGKGKKRQVFEVSDDDDDDDDDVVMLDDNDSEDNVNHNDEDVEPESDSQSLFIKSQTAAPSSRSRAKAPSTATASRSRAVPKSSAAVRNNTASRKQTQLNFGNPPSHHAAGPASRAGGRSAKATAPPKRLLEPSEDEISDDEDAFEPAPSTSKGRAGGRR